MIFRANGSIFGILKKVGRGQLLGIFIDWLQLCLRYLELVRKSIICVTPSWLHDSLFCEVRKRLFSSSPRPPLGKMDEIENRLLSKLSGAPARHDWQQFETSFGEWKIHSIELCNPEAKYSDAALVILHGIFAGALSWLPVMDDMAKKFKQVIFVDLPGNGRSIAPTKIWKLHTPDKLVDLYLEGLEGWRKSKGLPKICLIGHSFGGFLASIYTSRYPAVVQHVILIAPGGQIPISGPNTWFMGVLFSITAQSILRCFGPELLWVFEKFLWNHLGKDLCDELLLYYFYLSSSPKSSVDIALSKFLDFPTSYETFWTYPAFGYLKGIQAPLTLVWGHKDPLLDVEQGYFLHYFLKNIDLYVILKASHNPAHSRPDRFSSTIEMILTSSSSSQQSTTTTASPPTEKQQQQLTNLEKQKIYDFMEYCVRNHVIGCISKNCTLRRRVQFFRLFSEYFISSNPTIEVGSGRIIYVN